MKKITITVVDKMGPIGCHHGHRIGGGTVPKSVHGDIRVACPDADVVNVFRIDVEEKKD